MLNAKPVRSFCVGLTLLASLAFAEDQVEDQSLWDRCYGGGARAEAQPWLGAYYYGPVINPVPPPVPLSGSGLGGVTSGGSAPAFLVLAVVAVAALPVIVYALDNPAPARMLHRFRCPSFSFEGSGGVEQVGASVAAVATGRFRFGYSHFGADVQFDAAPDGVTAFSTAVLLRPTPREHLEGGLSAGYKRSYLGATMREGLEIALPHQYIVWRNEGRELGVELRPGVMISRAGVDASVDLGLNIPILEVLSARVGTRVFSYGNQVLVAGSAGLSLHL